MAGIPVCLGAVVSLCVMMGTGIETALVSTVCRIVLRSSYRTVQKRGRAVYMMMYLLAKGKEEKGIGLWLQEME